MGLRYVLYRIIHEVEKRVGVLQKRFPTNPKSQQFTILEEWEKKETQFFGNSRESLKFTKNKSEKLKERALKIMNGEVQFFHSQWKMLGTDYDWITNPDSDYTYPLDHWSKISDFSSAAGDIKYVWEKSRFSYIQTIIRYDYHFDEDHAEWVFSEMDSWIASNPINQGPNWVCSQETSLRLLNWCFILSFYRNSSSLTEERWTEYQNVIYWKLHHIYHNINFSLIAVRNNHAITEALTLYIGGLLFPDFDNSQLWREKGKQWFEEEIAYQIYEDGSYLQFSHNYHRVVIQLLTWALNISELYNDPFKPHVYDRAEKSIDFLYQQMSLENGELPNYGNNDGALFFDFSNATYRDYRPQLNALYYALHKKHLFVKHENLEDVYWYSNDIKNDRVEIIQNKTILYPKGGFYGIRDEDSYTFIRCGSHKDRPAQADNLHLDIWVNGKNMLRDAGTYKYNTDNKLSTFFFGTRSHNTVMLGDNDQMLKGTRFIWLNWSQADFAKIEEEDEYYLFEGRVKVFQHLNPSITHSRIVKKYKNDLKWEVIDHVSHNTDLAIKQIWNFHPEFVERVKINAKDDNGELVAQRHNGWYSSHYGEKEATQQLVFSTNQKKIVTEITIDN